MDWVGSSQLFSGFLGALIATVVGSLINLWRDLNFKKMQNRSFVSVEEIYGLGTRLEGYKSSNKEIKLIETQSLKHLINLQNQGSFNNTGLNYLRITNLGPSSVTDVQISIRVFGIYSGKNEKIKKKIPVVSPEQEVFILAQASALHQDKQLLKNVTITYNTLAGEEIKYLYDVMGEGDNKICKEQYFYKILNKYKKFVYTETEPVNWIYVNYKRDEKYGKSN